jgi:hypothetical protein
MGETKLAADPIRAPFTPEQIDVLNRYQANDMVHPYTCEHWHGDPAERRNLVATKDGWICRYCDYRQSWAHGSHFENTK